MHLSLFLKTYMKEEKCILKFLGFLQFNQNSYLVSGTVKITNIPENDLRQKQHENNIFNFISQVIY